MVTLRLQRQLVKLFERENLCCGASVHWSVETIQQQIQFTECCDHLWLSSLPLFHYDFSAFLLKFAGIILTLVKTIKHAVSKRKQFCPLFTWFALLVWLELATLRSFLTCNVEMFRNLLWYFRHFLIGSPFCMEWVRTCFHNIGVFFIRSLSWKILYLWYPESNLSAIWLI